MALTLVWAFQRLAELNGATGFVECEGDVAKELIAKGLVQDPAVGGLALREIGSAPAPAAPLKSEPVASPHDYRTTQLQPEQQHTTDLTPPKGRKSRGR